MVKGWEWRLLAKDMGMGLHVGGLFCGQSCFFVIYLLLVSERELYTLVADFSSTALLLPLIPYAIFPV
ncbi:hypothetical protein J3E72DRAFT_286955 [Bipolaris maydis]|nr:hypothetical protein J3E72DRAFT_286955 [Bipolaris maydis]KAJ6285136.1 hypothetical protein J3E71DRAFT_270340 [Bipolaris maydis]